YLPPPAACATYTLSLHDALPIFAGCAPSVPVPADHVSIPIAPPAAVQSYASLQGAKFDAFIRDFRAVAIQAGIRPETYAAAMAGLRPNPRVEELNRKQPEFVKPVWEYLAATVSPARLENGRAMLDRYGSTLAALEARYAVP